MPEETLEDVPAAAEAKAIGVLDVVLLVGVAVIAILLVRRYKARKKDDKYNKKLEINPA